MGVLTSFIPEALLQCFRPGSCKRALTPTADSCSNSAAHILLQLLTVTAEGCTEGLDLV